MSGNVLALIVVSEAVLFAENSWWATHCLTTCLLSPTLECQKLVLWDDFLLNGREPLFTTSRRGTFKLFSAKSARVTLIHLRWCRNWLSLIVGNSLGIYSQPRLMLFTSRNLSKAKSLITEPQMNWFTRRPRLLPSLKCHSRALLCHFFAGNNNNVSHIIAKSVTLVRAHNLCKAPISLESHSSQHTGKSMERVWHIFHCRNTIVIKFWMGCWRVWASLIWFYSIIQSTSASLRTERRKPQWFSYNDGFFAEEFSIENAFRIESQKP